VRLANPIRIGLTIFLLAVVALVVAGVVASGPAATVTGLLVLAALVLAIPVADFRELLENLKSLKFGPEGIAAEWFQRARPVAAVETAEQQEKPATDSTSMSQLRLLLEAKLAYIAKDLLDEQPTFVTIGSLNYDGYLDDETANVADGLMTLRDEDLRGLDAQERGRLLRTGDDIVRTIRARTLQGWVRKILDNAAAWRWEPVDRGPNKVPDYLAIHGEQRLLVAAVFATSRDSQIFGWARTRLEDGKEIPDDVSRRVIVLPRRARDEMIDRDGDPAVIRAQDLSGLLTKAAN
jgi:hypothetical protein